MSDAPEIITVDVKGAVKTTRCLWVAPNSRVHDAIYKAGGMTADANSQSVNLAQNSPMKQWSMLLKKGRMFQHLEVQKVLQLRQRQQKNRQGPFKSSNRIRSPDSIRHWPETCPGYYRLSRSNGPFRSVDDLKNVSGIGEKTLEKLRDAFTVD